MTMFEVEPEELSGYATYMRSLATAFDRIDGYAREEGCETDGFTGLLALLRPAVGLVGDLYGAGLDFGRDRLEGAADGLELTALEYERTDEANATSLAVVD
jgi:hypothetical protein